MKPPLRIGLTGSIGMGKSTIAAQCQQLGLPVFCADKSAHQLLATDAVAKEIAQQFPDVIKDGIIDRSLLGQHVFGHAENKAWLERLLHPKIREREEQLYHSSRVKEVGALVCDIPLLFETGGNDRMDVIMVVDAPAWMQAQRVLKRKGMTVEKLRAICASQWPQADKCALADCIIPTSLGKRYSLQIIRHFLKSVGLCVK